MMIAIEMSTHPHLQPFKNTYRAMKKSWGAYEACALGQDEVLPLSCAGQRWFDLALTATDRFVRFGIVLFQPRSFCGG